jgi:O-antigen/teichoic acid export membrane protein
MLGSDDVGQYRAATAISTGYLSFFLTALTQDFLPRISAATDAGESIELVERRMRLVMGVAVPIILGLLALGPWLVDVLYSEAFRRAFDMLQWLLVGDLIRLPAWVLGYVLIAHARPVAYLGYELSVGILVVASTFVGIGIAGLAGAGVGYAATQLVMYGVVWWLVRRRLHASPGRLQLIVVFAAIISAALLATVSDPVIRLFLFGSAAVIVGMAAWPRLFRLHRAGAL